MAGHVYHWKHGWIPLDREAAVVKAHGAAPHGPHPVAAKDLARTRNIAVVHNPATGKFALQDRKSGHTVGVSMSVAAHLHHNGHTVTTVHADGTFSTTSEHRLTAAGEPVATVEAARLVKAATAAEPELTALLSGLATEHGGKMEGLKYRVKTADSLARKIEGDIAEARNNGKALSAAEAGAKMFDVNRYTTVHPEASYVASTQATLDALRAQGYKLNVKNFWNVDGNPYRSINVQVTAPNGQKFELQLHTPKSLHVKETGLHPLYEKFRVEPSQAKRDAYSREMHVFAATIPEPPGVRNIR